MGILVPPCILMIIYAMLTETSIAQLFAAGFLPAALMASGMIVGTYVPARRRKFPVEAQFSLREVGLAARRAFFPMMMPVIIELLVTGYALQIKFLKPKPALLNPEPATRDS